MRTISALHSAAQTINKLARFIKYLEICELAQIISPLTYSIANFISSLWLNARAH